MRNFYIIQLSDGSVLRNRGGLRRTLRRYGRLSEVKSYSLFARFSYAACAMFAAVKNRITPQVWRIVLEVRIDSKLFSIKVEHEGSGFVADCFVRIIGNNSFVLLYELFNPITDKGEIIYRQYRVHSNGVDLVLERSLLAHATRHFSYPAIFEVNRKSLWFSVECCDKNLLELYCIDFEGNILNTMCLSGEFVDPFLVASSNPNKWLLLYSTKSRPDELVIRGLERKGERFVLQKSAELRVLNCYVARGGGDVCLEWCDATTLKLIRYSQVALPVYGSHLIKSELTLVLQAGRWTLSDMTLDTAFGADFLRKTGGKGTHTYSNDRSDDLSVIAYDWR